MAQHPASFADVVAKVKPAVVSVRVKVNATAETGRWNRTATRMQSAQSEFAYVQVLPEVCSGGHPGLRHAPNGYRLRLRLLHHR